MKLNIRVISILFPAILLFLLISCTTNPLGKDESIQENNIFGKVTLNDGQDPGNIFVWLEPFDLSTRTDSDGSYSLRLPNPSAQSSGGINGFHKLYFYVANYKINYLDIPFTNGRVEQTSEFVTLESGELPPIQLQKILDIDAFLYEVLNTESEYDSILVHFMVQAMENDVTVKSIFSNQIVNPGPQFMAGLVHSLDSNNPFLRTFLYENPEKGHRASTFKVTTDPTLLIPLLVYIPQSEFADGWYEFIPYITVEQPDVPDALLNNLGKEAASFSTHFIEYPLKVRKNQLNTDFASIQ